MKTFTEQVKELVRLGALDQSKTPAVFAAHIEHPDKSAIDIVDSLGIRHLTHSPLDMVERYRKLVTGQPSLVHMLRCHAIGLDGYKSRLIGAGMRLFNGACNPALIEEEMEKLSKEIYDITSKTHPGRDLLLRRHIPHSLLNDVEQRCAKNDRAHQMDHVYGVVCLANEIVDRHVELVPWRDAVLLGALMHDVAHSLGREKHHETGALIAHSLIFTHMPSAMLSGADILAITASIREHRSSFKGERAHIVSQAVAAADLGVPNGGRYVDRAMVFQYDRYLNGKSCLDGDEPITTEEREELFQAVIDHMAEKYGAKGYSWEKVSPYTMSAWPVEVRKAQEFCDNPTLIREHIYTKAWPKAVKKLIGIEIEPIKE